MMFRVQGGIFKKFKKYVRKMLIFYFWLYDTYFIFQVLFK